MCADINKYVKANDNMLNTHVKYTLTVVVSFMYKKR